MDIRFAFIPHTLWMHNQRKAVAFSDKEAGDNTSQQEICSEQTGTETVSYPYCRT